MLQKMKMVSVTCELDQIFHNSKYTYQYIGRYKLFNYARPTVLFGISLYIQDRDSEGSTSEDKVAGSESFEHEEYNKTSQRQMTASL